MAQARRGRSGRGRTLENLEDGEPIQLLELQVLEQTDVEAQES